MSEIKIRELNVKDIFAVARMLGKVTRGARVQFASVLTGKKANPTEIGMVLFQSLVIDAEEDLKSWLADLAGKTKQITKDGETFTVPDVTAFGDMPATAVLDVIEGLLQQEGIRDFFVRASALANRIPG